MTLEAHETLRDHILSPEISRADQLQQRPPFFFRPSLLPDPLTPRRRSACWPSTVRRAQKQFPCRQADSVPISGIFPCKIPNIVQSSNFVHALSPNVPAPFLPSPPHRSIQPESGVILVIPGYSCLKYFLLFVFFAFFVVKIEAEKAAGGDSRIGRT